MSNPIPLISKYRSELMGLAMLFVIYSHIPVPFSYWPLCVIQWNGHFGVDMFLALSGLGLVFSISNSNNVLKFYKRRIIRIFPIYTIVNLLYLIYPIYKNLPLFSVSDIFLTCTTVGYWFDLGYCDWFIPHVVLMYVIFPVLWGVIKKINSLFAILLIFILWGLFGLLNLEDTFFYRASYRWLDFVLGIIVGKIMLENNIKILDVSKILFFILLVFGVLLSIYYHFTYAQNTGFWFNNPLFFNRGYVYSPYTMVVIGILILFCCLFDYLEVSGISKVLMFHCGRFLSFTGHMSIELYLVHITLVNTIFIPTIFGLIAFIVETYVLAYILHIVNKKVMFLLQNSLFLSSFLNKI